MPWQAAHRVLNRYSPLPAPGMAAAAAYVLTGFPFLHPKKSLIIAARNFGFSTAEFRIHSPVASFPTIKVGWCPSRLHASVGDDRPSFLLTSRLSSSLPVRNSQPGPARKRFAYARSTSGVSGAGSMLIE